MPRKGENIRKRKDGRWEGRFVRHEFSGSKSKSCSVYANSYKEVKEKLYQAKNQMLHQMDEHVTQNSSSSAVLFANVAEDWLAYVLESRKYSTYVKYRRIYDKYVLDFLRGQNISDISQELVEREMANREQTAEEHTISVSLQKSIYCVMNQILSYASKKYHIALNPLKREQPKGKTDTKPIQIFQTSEQQALLGFLQKDMDLHKLGIFMCLYTGMRLGELCALKWADIDMENRIIHISSTIQRLPVRHPQEGAPKTTLMETAPKSICSRREIPICDMLFQQLKQLKHGDSYVIGGKKAVDPRTYQKKFASYLKEANIPYRSFHTLRHTFASTCAANGTDPKALSEILGHSGVQITLNRYVHPSMETKRNILNMLHNGYMGQKLGQVS